MSDEESTAHHQQRLAIYRRTLRHLLKQAASYGGELFSPVSVMNGIYEARKSIDELKATLRALGVSVADEPDEKPRVAVGWLPVLGRLTFRMITLVTVALALLASLVVLVSSIGVDNSATPTAQIAAAAVVPTLAPTPAIMATTDATSVAMYDNAKAQQTTVSIKDQQLATAYAQQTILAQQIAAVYKQQTATLVAQQVIVEQGTPVTATVGLLEVPAQLASTSKPPIYSDISVKPLVETANALATAVGTLISEKSQRRASARATAEQEEWERLMGPRRP